MHGVYAWCVWSSIMIPIAANYVRVMGGGIAARGHICDIRLDVRSQTKKMPSHDQVFPIVLSRSKMPLPWIP